MAWKPAPSVAAALREANARWPGRSRASDGILGDTAHSARVSDHNPDAHGIVHAFDLTDDPVGGVDCDELSVLLVRRRDKRVRYIIWNRRIIYGPWSTGVLNGTHKAWAGWETYTGVNAHTKHMHVSVGYSAAAEHDVSPWWADAQKEEGFMAEDVKQIRDDIEAVKTKVEATFNHISKRSGDVFNETHAVRAEVAELRKLFEGFLLKQGGSENPTGRLP